MSVQMVNDVFGGGDSKQVELLDSIGKASARLEDIATEMSKAKDEDTARWDALNEERKAQAQTLEELKQAHDAKVREDDTKAAIEMAAEAKAALAQMRAPSKALAIGSGPNPRQSGRQAGDFLTAVYESTATGGEHAAAKARLEEWSRWEANTKATLGSSAATGGWIIPNDMVDDIITPGVHSSPILDLVTVVRGVTTAGVDIPFRTSAPTASVAIAWGSLKTNADLVYGGYTATMYTLASIYDVSKQFLQKSAGAAERDVMQELNGALDRGLVTYIFQGTGSSQPFGLNAALVTSPPFSPVTTSSHSPAATIAGNMGTAIATAAGALESRSRRAEAVIMAPTAYWAGVAAGADAAGFYISPAAGSTNVNAVAQLSIWGIPVFRESEYLTATDDMIIGEFSALKVYFGEGQRIDSTDIAGTRWDYNLVGFRGELEVGFDFRPAVYAGALQFVADIIT
jgi:HK97 family phage major capsid protein